MAVYYNGYQNKKVIDKYARLKAFVLLLTTKNREEFIKTYSFITRGRYSSTGAGIWRYVENESKCKF